MLLRRCLLSRFMPLVVILWLIVVATEWSYKDAIEKLVANQQLVPSKNKNELPATQIDSNLVPPGNHPLQTSFICNTALMGSQVHRPIVIVANARTGSNLFFSFIKNLVASQKSQVDVLNLYEFFGDDMALIARGVSQILDRIQVGCGWDVQNLYADQTFSTPDEVLAAARSEFGASPVQRQVIEHLQQVTAERLNNPASILDFIRRVPSNSPQAYFALKVFPDQVTRLMKTTISDFLSLFSNMETQYVILWRRNLLEIFVSFQIARNRKKWTNVPTTEDDAVVVEKAVLEQFVRQTVRYYWEARDYFAINAIRYEEFEYNRDLSDERYHFDVLLHIQTILLHLPYNEQVLLGILDTPKTAKQALVPLSKQIINWQDLASWGYSESSEDWPDILAISSEEKNELVPEQKETKSIWNESRPISTVVLPNDSFNYVCVTTKDVARPHQPILIVANARTGSNLFFAFIKNLASKQEDEVDVLNLYEFFGDDDALIARVLCRIIDQIQRGCGWDINTLFSNRKFASPEQVFASALTELSATPSQRQVIEELQQVMSQRLENPAGILDFIHRVPSRLPHAYFALKVFPDQVTRLMKTTVQQFMALFSGMETQYVILWRRNMLEIFVSFQIAKQMKKWTNVGTTEEDAVEVNHAELQQFIQTTTEFYLRARDYLDLNSIVYEEFEYNRDLSDEEHHFSVVQRIQTSLLHQPYNEELLRSVLDPPGLAKQAVVPLSRQIVNWEDVASWGYSETLEEWPNLFV